MVTTHLYRVPGVRPDTVPFPAVRGYGGDEKRKSAHGLHGTGISQLSVYVSSGKPAVVPTLHYADHVGSPTAVVVTLTGRFGSPGTRNATSEQMLLTALSATAKHAY